MGQPLVLPHCRCRQSSFHNPLHWWKHPDVDQFWDTFDIYLHYKFYTCLTRNYTCHKSPWNIVHLPPSHKCSPHRCQWQRPVWSVSSWWRDRQGSKEGRCFAGGSGDQGGGGLLQGQPLAKPKPGPQPGRGGTCFPGILLLFWVVSVEETRSVYWSGKAENRSREGEITTKWAATQMQVDTRRSLLSSFLVVFCKLSLRSPECTFFVEQKTER